MGMTKGLYPAPLKIIEVIKTGLAEGREKGFEAEARVSLYLKD
jgi:enoyl-CoA hydratase / long-chain 3-hydroxyacyl-CoA dehydrogenase